jgi:hypothetical protein
MRVFGLVLAALLLWSSRGLAQTTLTVAFISDPSGISLSGSGTSSASLSFGTVQAFGGTLPTGVAKSVAANNWTLSTPIDVRVQKGALDIQDLLSTSYTLTARLQAADVQNTWKLHSVTLSTTSATITSTGAYNSTVAHSFSLTVPFSASAGGISNTINITVTAN